MSMAPALRVHAFLPRSTVNGPGLRSVLWVQGCTLGCEGCFNPLTHDLAAGQPMTVAQVLELIPADVEGLTISGGEPMLQAEACLALVRACRERGLNALVYTGMSYHRIIDDAQEHQLHILNHIDWLVDGAYQKDSPPTHPWAGSGNQRVITLNPELLSVALDPASHNCRQAEIFIAADGSITTTGF